MASDLMLDFENHVNQHHIGMNSDTGDICIDQDGEWDLSLFDELEDMGDADELLRALEDVAYVGEVPDLDLGLDLPLWNSGTCGDTSSSCTDADMSVGSLSPNPTLSSVSSPGSVEALSPCSLSDELLSPQSQTFSQSQPSPASMSPEFFSSSESALGRKPQRRAGQSRVKSSLPQKRPIQLIPKVSIQPKPVITAVPIPHSTAPLQAKTFIIQPLQAVLPVAKPAPVSIQPAPPAGRPAVLPQPAGVLHLRGPLIAPATPVLSFPNRLVAVPTLSPATAVTRPLTPTTLSNDAMDGDMNVVRRQQRIIKNRESASLSRKKKKEYLLTLEARLKVALSENENLKSENGSLKKQLDGLVTENSVLQATAPKRRTVCLLVVLVFLVMNVGQLRLLDGDSSSKLSAGTMNSGRHLLGFSPENLIGQEPPEGAIPQAPDRYEDSTPEKKALMVVKKEPLFLEPSPPCQPFINRTKSIKMAHELRGWVHRHEVERTKSRRTTNSQHKTKTIPNSPDEKAEVAQIVTVQYTDMSEKSPGSELQVYYAPHRGHYDFLEEIHRRGDTFYVVSFRRDHLLLPATNHNKRSRPKMSVVLPAMNINDSVIKDKEYEVMMQIDCEVMDTRILHIKSSSIPPFLRVNHTEPFYHSGPVHGQATPPVGVLTGSA